MVLVKIVCVISGYERRLPNIQFIDPEEQRRILDRSVTEPLSVSNSQEEPVSRMCQSYLTDKSGT